MRTVRLRHVFDIVNGGTPTSASENWDGDVPWATPVDLARVHGGHLAATDRTLTELGLRTGSRSVPGGSLILSTRAPIGYVTETAKATAFNQGCKGLVPRCEVDVRFFRYQLHAVASALVARGQGATFLELSADALADVPLTVPDVREQRAIADFLDAETARIDAVIAHKTRLNETAARRHSMVMRSLVAEDRTYADPMQVQAGEPPVDVEIRKVAWDFSLGGGTTPRSDDADYFGGETPWVVTGDLSDGPIRGVPGRVTSQALAVYPALTLHPAGSLVVAMYGATAGKLGLTTFATTTNQACCVLTARSGHVLTEFLFYWLLAFRPELVARAVGAGQPNISQEVVRSLRIAIPPISRQLAVVAELDVSTRRLSENQALITRQIDLLKERRQALITAAVTGQMAVPGVPA